ncbi:P-loop containing nucleoside triphosphate hydrolase protein [Apiospora arundinis]
MAPGTVEDDVSNGTTEVAHRPKGPEKAISPEATTNGHTQSQEPHQKCCCCCQLRSKEDVKHKKEDKDEASEDSKTKEDEAKKKEGEKSDKDASDDKRDKEPQDETMKCEIKHLDRKYDDKDEAFFAERKDEIEKPEQKDWWRMYAFCLVRHFDSDGDLDDTRLYVNALPLRQLIYDVIGNYPSEPIDVDDIQISAPYHCLFHYRKELEAEGVSRFEKAADEESMKQLVMLMDWIKKHFELEIAAYERCVTNQVKAIAFDKLWTIFRPKTLVHTKVLKSNRAFRVWDHWEDDDYGEDESTGLVLRVEYVDYDGDNLGTQSRELFLPKYSGTRELSKLSTMPLDLLEDGEEQREALLKRGRMIEGYTGQHFMQYNGVGLKHDCNGITRLHVNSRVMIDCKTFHQEKPNLAFTVKELPPVDKESAERRAERRALRRHGAADDKGEEEEARPLSDEEAIIATSMVRGYAFANKEFLDFFVEDLSDIEWNDRCFDELVLDSGTKRTVQALVSMHSTRQSSFDDIVKGKGQGLVCVLHGPPGVGKTLTAECVAEYVKRPLYMVSSGDLGIDASNLDRSLAKIMRMTSAWRAVLLIDEADVFLEERSPQNLHRNAMVSVFLRLLEYFSGILFLTTNRVQSFDDAFKSRIHIPIRYTNLSQESRLQIWRNFLARVPRGEFDKSDDKTDGEKGELAPLVSEKDLATLAEHDLNGRQIKNVIKAAESLAAFEGKSLNMEQLQEVTKIQARFEADLTNLSGIDYNAPGASRKDADLRQMFL